MAQAVSVLCPSLLKPSLVSDISCRSVYSSINPPQGGGESKDLRVRKSKKSEKEGKERKEKTEGERERKWEREEKERKSTN